MFPLNICPLLKVWLQHNCSSWSSLNCLASNPINFFLTGTISVKTCLPYLELPTLGISKHISVPRYSRRSKILRLASTANIILIMHFDCVKRAMRWFSFPNRPHPHIQKKSKVKKIIEESRKVENTYK